jgi:hypothetical protein
MKKLPLLALGIISSVVATSALAATDFPTYTIINGLKNTLPADFTNVLAPAIGHVIVQQPFGQAIDVENDQQWTMENNSSSHAQQLSFDYFYKLPNGEYTDKVIPAGPSCANLDLSKSFTTTISIDESDPANPHTVCS